MRRVVVLAVLVAAVPALSQAQSSPSGEAVYKQHCAGCHEGSLPRAPNREALRAMAPEAIDTALSSFSMRRQAAALSSAERRAVAAFLAGRAPGSYGAPLDMIGKEAYCAAGTAAGTAPRDPLAGPSWNGWGVDTRNSRSQTAAAAGLTAADVPKLKLKWAFGVPGVSASGSQITVVGSRAFVGSRNGVVYALDTKTGCLVWAFEADAGVRSTPVVGNNAVYFGDAHAQVYALDVNTGQRRWKVKLEDHLDAMITGAAAFNNGRLYVPVSSLEEGTAAIPNYECCTFRGSVVALDAASGKQIWKTYTISQAPQRTAKTARGTQLWGPSGGAVWSQPAIDAERNRIYITTGDAYSKPAARETDAVMALAMDTGRVLWTQQTLAGDAWNVGCLDTGAGRAACPEGAGPDHDFSSSPAVGVLPDGKRVIIAGQKSGELFGLNPDTGEQVWKTRVGQGGILGGIEWGFSVEATTAYVSLSNAVEKKPGEAGGMVAVNIADGKPRWTLPPSPDTCEARRGCNTGQPAAVSSIPGVVFSGSLDGHLRAYDSATGEVLWDVNTVNEYDTVNRVPARGGSMNGPGATIVGGMLFVNSGYSSLGFMAGNVILAFSVEGK